MTALEERLRHVLHGFDPLALRTIRDPYGPDEVVFGPEQPDWPPADPWPITRTCSTHAVDWGDHKRGCWCCEAGVKPL